MSPSGQAEDASSMVLRDRTPTVRRSSLLAAVSIPNLAGYLRIYKIRGAAQQVASELQAARFQAIKKNAHLGVVLVILDNRTYRTVIEDDMTLDGNGAVSGAGGGPAGTPRSIAGILADPACATGSSCAQAGPVRRLPATPRSSVGGSGPPFTIVWGPSASPHFRLPGHRTASTISSRTAGS